MCCPEPIERPASALSDTGSEVFDSVLSEGELRDRWNSLRCVRGSTATVLRDPSADDTHLEEMADLIELHRTKDQRVNTIALLFV